MNLSAKFSVSSISWISISPGSSISAEYLKVEVIGLLDRLTPTLCRSSTLMTMLHAVATAVVNTVGSGAQIACTASRVLRRVVGIASFCGLVRSGS